MGKKKQKHIKAMPDRPGYISGGVAPRKSLPRPGRKVLLMLGGVLAIGLLVFFASRLLPQKSLACSDATISEAAGYIKDNNTEQLNKITAKITATKGYDSDVNCLYIVTVDNVKVGNAANSRKALDALEKNYNEEDGYSPLLGSNPYSPGQLQGMVEFLEQTASQPAPVFGIGGDQ